MKLTYLRDRSIEQARFSGQYPAAPGRDCSRYCGALAGNEMGCTRPDGHEGIHVAHGMRGEALAWWDAARRESEVV